MGRVAREQTEARHIQHIQDSTLALRDACANEAPVDELAIVIRDAYGVALACQEATLRIPAREPAAVLTDPEDLAIAGSYQRPGPAFEYEPRALLQCLAIQDQQEGTLLPGIVRQPYPQGIPDRKDAAGSRALLSDCGLTHRRQAGRVVDGEQVTLRCVFAAQQIEHFPARGGAPHRHRRGAHRLQPLECQPFDACPGHSVDCRQSSFQRLLGQGSDLGSGSARRRCLSPGCLG